MAQSPKSPGLVKGRVEKYHKVEEFLDLTWEELHREPVYITEEEEDPEQIAQGEEGEVISEERFLELAFENLFDVPVRAFRLRDSDTQEGGDEARVQSAGSSFGTLRIIQVGNEFDNDFNYIDSSTDLDIVKPPEVSVITSEQLPPVDSPDKDEPVPNAPLFYAGALQEKTGQTQTITGNLQGNINSQFINSPEDFAFNNIFNNLVPTSQDGTLNLDIFLRPNSGQTKTTVAGSSKVTLTTDAGNTLEFYTHDEGGFLKGDFIYTLQNPIYHGDNPFNIPQVDNDSLVLDSNGDFVPTVPELNFNLFLSLLDSFEPNSFYESTFDLNDYQMLVGLDQTDELVFRLIEDDHNPGFGIEVINSYDLNNLFGFLNGDGDGDIVNTYYEVFVYDAVDGNGDRSRNFIVFKIVDDQPVAVDDTADFNETLFFVDDVNHKVESIDGNLLDNDDQGFDGASVLSLDGVEDNSVNDFNNAVGIILINTDYGQLEVNTMSGEYTYTYVDASSVLDAETEDDTVAVVIIDGDSDTSDSVLTVTIDLNQAPDAVADTNTVSADETLGVNAAAGLLANDTDPDNVPPDELHVIAVEGDGVNVGHAITLDRTLSIPDHNNVAVDVDVAPLLQVNADGSYSFDPDGTFAALAQSQEFSIFFEYTMTDAEGLVTDEAALQSTETVTMTVVGVNDAPTINASDGDDTLVEDGNASASGDLMAMDIDISDNNTLTVNHSNANSDFIMDTTGGNISIVGDWGTLSIDALAEWSYVLDNSAAQSLAQDQQVSDVFNVVYSDPYGEEVNSTITLTVTGVNDDPVAQDDEYDLNEDDAVLVDNVITNVTPNGADSDVDTNDTLSVTEVNEDSAKVATQFELASGALLTLNAEGTLTYEQNGAFQYLAESESTTDSFTYTLSDGLVTDTATVTMTINGANDAPVAQDDEYDLNEDDAVLVDNVITNVTPNGADSDVDTNDTLSVTEVNGDSTKVATQFMLASGALLTLNADGSLTYDQDGAFQYLAESESTTDSFTYTLSDGLVTDTATVTMTINGANDAPVAQDDEYAINEDDVTFVDNVITNVNPNGADSDVDDNDTLSVTEVNGDPTKVANQFALASGALLTLNAEGILTYEQNGAFQYLAESESTTDSFTYTLSDGLATDIATVTMIINGANDAPVAQDDEYTINEDNALLVDNVITNVNPNGADSDVDTNDSLSVTEVNGDSAKVATQFTLASGALLTLNADGSFTYDQNGAFQNLAESESTTDSFTYTLSDGTVSDSATVDITIDGVADVVPPVILDLNKNGSLELLSAQEGVVLTLDGQEQQVGWVAPNDGILMFDRDGDGTFSSINEISFVDDHPDATTDLEGLRLAYDTNGDNVFDAQDDLFDQFGVWQDKNTNGMTDAGEFNSLFDHGIISINLISSEESQILEGNIIYGTSDYTMENGEIGLVGDVGLDVQPLAESDVFKDVQDGPNLNDLLGASTSEVEFELVDQDYEPMMEPEMVNFDSQQSLDSIIQSNTSEQPDI